MMMLLFNVDCERFAMDVADVVELVPCVTLQHLPKAPDYISGLMNYRGNIVPVVDLGMLVGEGPVRVLMSSRIILTKPVKTENRYIGLLAEKVTETKRISPEEFTGTGVKADACAFVDKIVMDSAGMIQVINLQKLLPDDVNIMLNEKAGESGCSPAEGGEDVA